LPDNDPTQLLELAKQARKKILADVLVRIGNGSSSPSDWRLLRDLQAEAELSANPQAEPVFPNLLKALEYLHSQGYRIKKSSLYNHRKAGLLKSTPAGEYAASELTNAVSRTFTT